MVKPRIGVLATLVVLTVGLTACTPESGVIYEKKTTTEDVCVSKNVSHRCIKTEKATVYWLCLEDGRRNRGCKKVTEKDYSAYEKDQRYP